MFSDFSFWMMFGKGKKWERAGRENAGGQEELNEKTATTVRFGCEGRLILIFASTEGGNGTVPRGGDLLAGFRKSAEDL